ncbi:hypothetical protein V8E51_010994 [Hyaloscypha variabilis]
MFSNLSKKRPSLGQMADLGDLYDARTDTFVSLSILNSSPPPSVISSVDNPTSELEFTNNDTYEEKFSKLRVTAELGASFLSGMVSVGGSGRFLTETRSSNRTRQVACLYNTTTVREKLNLTAFTNPDLKTLLNLDVIQSGAGLAKLSVIASVGTKAEGEFEKTKQNSQATFEIKVYGDFVADDDIPTDFESACRYIKNMPASIAASKGGKGKPLVYTLLPLEMLHFIYDLELKHHISLKQLSLEVLEQFVHLFDEWCSARQRLNDYHTDVTSHQFCLPRQHLNETVDQLNQVKAGEISLRESYANALGNVRTGTADPQCLRRVSGQCAWTVRTVRDNGQSIDSAGSHLILSSLSGVLY